LAKRVNLVIYMEMLALLKEEPRVPTRLAQASNVPYDRLVSYLRVLESKGLVSKEMKEGHEIYETTEDGRQLYAEWQKVWEKLQP
jgi:predicted transcriptional regulator